MKLILILAFLLASCGTANSTSTSTSAPNSSLSTDQSITTTSSSISSVGLIELTLEELKQFDGRNGRKAYIAVDGFIYDVTGNLNWFLGRHNGYTAGADLTFEIDNVSPHGRSYLERVPLIGRIKG